MVAGAAVTIGAALILVLLIACVAEVVLYRRRMDKPPDRSLDKSRDWFV